jgi:hypothetical protein
MRHGLHKSEDYMLPFNQDMVTHKGWDCADTFGKGGMSDCSGTHPVSRSSSNGSINTNRIVHPQPICMLT